MNSGRIKLSLALFFFVIILNSCNEQGKTKNAFLIRTNHVQFDDFQKELLQQTNTKQVYIKIFDVVFNEWQQRPLPFAQVEFDSASLKWLKGTGIEIVPVLYINNDLLEKVNPERINALGDRIMMLLKTRLDQFDLVKEKTIHIDCDWSFLSKEKYFDLLRYFQQLPFFSGKQISVSVRPRQVENSAQFETPPVNKVVYTLDIQGEKFDPSVVSKYPLPLDISLPLFNEPVVYRNNSVMGAITGLPDSAWQNEKVCQKAGDFFEVIKDTVVRSLYFKKGDQVEYKVGDTAAPRKIAALLKDQLKSPETTIILNQLDSLKIRQYNASQLEAAFNSFNKN